MTRLVNTPKIDESYSLEYSAEYRILPKDYAHPILFSGLSSLVLSKAKINLVSKHIKLTFQRIQKLYS